MSVNAFGAKKSQLLEYRSKPLRRSSSIGLSVFFAIGAAALIIDFIIMWWGQHKDELYYFFSRQKSFAVANMAEAALWAAMGLGFLIARIIRSGSIGIKVWILSVTLILFGFSDLIEIHTGAWWSPWWLLVLKGACVAVLSAFVLQYLREASLKKQS